MGKSKEVDTKCVKFTKNGAKLTAEGVRISENESKRVEFEYDSKI